MLLAKAAAGIALTLAFAAGWWLRAQGLTAGEYHNELRRGSDPRFDWRSVEKKHWQALGRAGVDGSSNRALSEERPELTDARENNTAGCATGMVRVKGKFRVELHGEATGEIERIQDGACTDWIGGDRSIPATSRAGPCSCGRTTTASSRCRPRTSRRRMRR